MNAFNVYKGKKLIDTVFYNDGITKEDVKHSLVNHDGMDYDITVSKVRRNIAKQVYDHVCDYINPEDYDVKTVQEVVVKQIDYMKLDKEYTRQAAKRWAEGGGFLVSNYDMIEIVKQWTGKTMETDKAFEYYIDRVANELTKIYNKAK